MLAAILIIIGYKLANKELFKEMFKRHYRQYIPFISTILFILFTNLLVGIVVGLLIAIYFILQDNRSNEPYDVTIKPSLNDDYAKLQITFKLYNEIHYLSKHNMLKSLHDIPRNSTVLIDGSETKYISDDVREVIREFNKNTGKEKNITLSVRESKIEYNEIKKDLVDEVSALNSLNL